MSRCSNQRPGFTLVELLVVITIIAILMSLTMNGVMSAREKGRMVQCANNLKQLGVALMSYESTFHVYPLNWGWGSDNGEASATRGQSWISLILPQMDQQPLYDRIKMGEKLDYFVQDPNDKSPEAAGMFDNSFVARVALPFLRCPTDLGNGTTMTKDGDPNFGQYLIPAGNGGQGTATEVAVTNYKACCGSFYPSWNTNPTEHPAIHKGRNFKPRKGLPSGVDRRDVCSGIICRGYNPTVTSKNKREELLFLTSSSDIYDGASYTIALGEALPTISPWSAWFWWNGSTASTGIAPTPGKAYSSPLNYALQRTRVDPQFLPSDHPEYFYGFNSRHANSAQFVMCDGSVHTITEGIDANVFYRLGTIDDREIIDNTALGW